MTKILFLTDDFPPVSGGISTYSYEITKNLADSGEDIIVLAPRYKGYQIFDKNEKQKLKIIRKSLPFKFKHSYYIKTIIQFFYLIYYVRKFNIKLIHCATWIPCGVAALLLYKIWRKPYIITTYALELLEPQQSRYRTGVMKLVLNNAYRVIAISNYTRNILLDLGISKQKIELIPLGVNIKRFEQKKDTSDIIKKYGIQNKKIILTVSTLIYPYKGHDRVIKALSKVVVKIPDATYLIVGGGPLKENLEDLVNKLKLENHVIFVGQVEHKDIVKYYNLCDVFIMPSSEDKTKGYVEGFGLVYLEANACGKPAIGGNCGGTKDAIVDGVTGLLVDPLNIDEIADAIIKILTDKNYAKTLGEKGRERVKREFSWEKIAEKTRNLYLDILNNSPRS